MYVHIYTHMYICIALCDETQTQRGTTPRAHTTLKERKKDSKFPLPVCPPAPTNTYLIIPLAKFRLGVFSACSLIAMGWLRLVVSFKSQVSFAEYSLFYRALLQKRPVILRSLLTKATPYKGHEPKKYKTPTSW